MSAAYYHKKRTPQFNRLIDDLQKKKQDRSRTIEERLREATERQEKLGLSIKLLTERYQMDAADKLRVMLIGLFVMTPSPRTTSRSGPSGASAPQPQSRRSLRRGCTGHTAGSSAYLFMIHSHNE